MKREGIMDPTDPWQAAYLRLLSRWTPYQLAQWKPMECEGVVERAPRWFTHAVRRARVAEWPVPIRGVSVRVACARERRDTARRSRKCASSSDDPPGEPRPASGHSGQAAS